MVGDDGHYRLVLVEVKNDKIFESEVIPIATKLEYIMRSVEETKQAWRSSSDPSEKQLRFFFLLVLMFNFYCRAFVPPLSTERKKKKE